MAPRKFFRRISPDHSQFKNHKFLRVFGSWLHNPNLWHINRRSTAGAFSVGFFVACFPLPVQMLLAASFAVVFHVNLPLSVLSTWISNPFTMIPLYYACYQLGAYLLGMPYQEVEIVLSLDWLLNQMGGIWQPLFLGSLVIGTLTALAINVIIRLLWRLWILHHWRLRKNRNGSRPNNNP